MSHVLHESESGLVVARERSDASAIARMLKAHDPDLRLIPSLTGDRVMWKVMKYMGGDKPAECVLVWMTETGEPLPLTSAIVDLVQKHDKRTRGITETDDVVNARVQANRQKARADRIDDIAEYMTPQLTGKRKVIIPRSTSLRMSRDKQRAEGAKV